MYNELFNPTSKQYFVLKNLIPNPDTYLQYPFYPHWDKLPFGLLKAVQKVHIMQTTPKEKRQSDELELYTKIEALPNLILPDYKPHQSTGSIYGHFIGERHKPLHPITRGWVFLIGKHIHDPEVFQWLITQSNVLHPALEDEIARALAHDKTFTMDEGLREAWRVLLLKQTWDSKPRYCPNFDDASEEADELKLWLRDILKPRIVIRPPHDYEKLSSKKFPSYRVELIFLHDDIEQYRLSQWMQKNTPVFWYNLFEAIEHSLKQYIELTKEITPKEDTLSFILEVASIIDHKQNLGFSNLVSLFNHLEACFEALIQHDEGTKWCADALERFASKPEALWYRIVLAYVTKYPDVLNPSLAWQVLRANGYSVIQHMGSMIRKEFFDLLESKHKNLSLPNDILEAIYTQIRASTATKYGNINWHPDRNYKVLETLKNNHALLPPDLDALYSQYKEAFKTDREADDSHKFPIYLSPLSFGDISKLPEDEEAIFKRFRKADSFKVCGELASYTEKYPQKGVKVFIALLMEAFFISLCYFDKALTKTLCYGDMLLLPWHIHRFEFYCGELAMYLRRGLSGVQLQERQIANYETQLKENALTLLPLYETLWALQLKDIAHSTSGYIRHYCSILSQEEPHRFWALFDKAWQASEELPEPNIGKGFYDDNFNATINQCIGKLLEALLSLELDRYRSGESQEQVSFQLSEKTKSYLEAFIQRDKAAYAYSMLGAYLPLLFQVHRAWAEAHLLPLITQQEQRSFPKSKALVEGIVGYGKQSYDLEKYLQTAWLNLDTKAYFSTNADMLKRHIGKLMSLYFYDEGDNTMTPIEYHKSLKAMPTESLNTVAWCLRQVNELTETSFNRVEDFFKIAWPKELNKLDAQQTTYFIMFAMQYPKHFRRIINLLKEENLIMQYEERGVILLPYEDKEGKKLQALSDEDFTLLCEVLCQHLPVTAKNTDYFLTELKVYLEKKACPMPECLQGYFAQFA